MNYLHPVPNGLAFDELVGFDHYRYWAGFHARGAHDSDSRR